MRLGYVLLLLLTTPLAASCDAVPLATDAKTVMKYSNTRSLRRREASNENISDTDANDEERTFSMKQVLGLEPNPDLFAKSYLKKMLKKDTFKKEMFEKWSQQDVSVAEIAVKLKVRSSSRFKTLFYEYINKYDTTATATAAKVPRDTKVTFGKNDVRIFDTDATLEWLRRFGR